MIKKSFVYENYRKKDKSYEKVLNGEQTQLKLVKLDKGTCIKSEHKYEEVGIILKGCVDLEYFDRKYELTAGDGYTIPMYTKYKFVVGDEPLEYLMVSKP